MAPGKAETIRIVVKTVDGEDGEFETGQATTVKEETDVAMGRFDIEPSPDASYRLALKTQDGQFTVLDPAKTLLDEGVKDGDTLWLGTEQAVGAAGNGPQARGPCPRAGPRMPGAIRPAPGAGWNMDGRVPVQACA